MPLTPAQHAAAHSAWYRTKDSGKSPTADPERYWVAVGEAVLSTLGAPMTNVTPIDVLTAERELILRAELLAHRRTIPGLAEQADRDERELLDITEGMDEHPEGYEGPCFCAECRSYGP